MILKAPDRQFHGGYFFDKGKKMNLARMLPRNVGVRRLCLILSILLAVVCCLVDWDFHKYHEFYLLSEEEGVWILPLLFVVPFIVGKAIEYIVDGFEQE